MNYIIHLGILYCIYFILALSINLVVGFSGLLTLSHGALFGLGAYVYTLSVMKLGMPAALAVVFSFFSAYLLSYLISKPIMRMSKHAFILATLGIQMIVYNVLYNAVPVTRGPYGIPGIPKPSFLGLQIKSLPLYLMYSIIMVSAVLYLTDKLYRSRFALILKGIRDNELSMTVLGKDTQKFKIRAFALGGAFAALGGVLFAPYITYISPASFTIDTSIFILTIIIIGGTCNIKGPAAGTAFMLLVPEALRFTGLTSAKSANLKQIIYGILLIVIIKYKSEGLLGEFRHDTD